MNKLLATLVAGTFAVVASSAFAQGTTGMQKEEKKDPKGSAAAYDNPAAEKTQAEKSKAGAAEVAKTKQDPKMRPGYNEKSAQELSNNSATNPAQARANVEASKAQSAHREKMPNIKNMTKEQRAELLRQLQKESTP